jgi:hypothetical protein
MYRIDDPSASPTLPVPEAALTEGYWTEGNPGTGTPATLERASWFNMVQEELCSLLAAAGITRSKTTYNQVNAALQKMYGPVIGTARNLAMNVGTASATATLTADEIVVGAAPGGQKYILPSFNKTVNLATTGAGGMDTGTAPTSGYVALYAIWNPTTSTAALLATNAATLQGNIYGGANMPAGYTASALISVWRTDSSGRFLVGAQIDRDIYLTNTSAFAGTTSQASYTALSIANIAPLNAKQVIGTASTIPGTVTSGSEIDIAGSTTGVGRCGQSAASGQSNSYFKVPLLTPQTIYYITTVVSGTLTINVAVSGYSI